MKIVNKIIENIVRQRSNIVVGRILPYIKNAKTLVDIGSGTGDVSLLLKQRGKDVTAVDVAGFHGPRLVEPIIYDGQKLPFLNNAFDTALLLMVLHHTPNPQIIFSEASRIASEIILIETSYTTRLSKWLTVLSDAIGNIQFNIFWNSYKTDERWRKFIDDNGYRIIKTAKYDDKNFGLPFLHIAYYLRKK